MLAELLRRVLEGRLVEEGDVLRYGRNGAEACAEDSVAGFEQISNSHAWFS
jgi:hypothetical protein